MVNSNERGSALEYRIAIELEKVFSKNLNLETRSSANTDKLNALHSVYFEDLDKKTQEDFDKCAIAFGKWIIKQSWFNNTELVTIDRLGDDKAKNRDPTDIQIGILKSTGGLILKNFSLKHNHNALCHPRLPSLPQQCGFEKGSKEDLAYRKKYSKIWENFGEKVKSLNKNIKTYKELDKINPNIKIDELYIPLMKNSISFMKKCYDNKFSAQSLFEYLVGTSDYMVIKNQKDYVLIKYFSKFKKPTKFKVKYPHNYKNHLLLEFSNGWKIDSRIHTASSRIFKENGKIFKTEKMDPACLNLNSLLNISKISKN